MGIEQCYACGVVRQRVGMKQPTNVHLMSAAAA